MINKLKKFCRKNKLIYVISRIVYYPIKTVVLYPIKKRLLNEAFEAIELMDKSRNTIFYFGVPVHKNLGDIAQTYCTQKWCSDNLPNYQLLSFKTYPTYYKKFQNTLKKIIKKDDIIIFQSGYCTTDNHLDHKMHRILVRLFPENRILILPQTVLFNNPDELRKTANIYNSHKRLLFAARDEISYEVAKKSFNQISTILYPDIVTSLIGSMKFKEEKKGILLCLRNDYEQLYSSKDIEVIEDMLKNVERIDKTDTQTDIPYDYLMNNMEDVLLKTFKRFASYKVVITDRYHGTIFSLIASTPVIILATVDHKVKSGADWFKGVYDNAVYLAKSPQEAAEIATTILNKDISITNSEFFNTNYYRKLKTKVEEL